MPCSEVPSLPIIQCFFACSRCFFAFFLPWKITIFIRHLGTMLIFSQPPQAKSKMLIEALFSHWTGVMGGSILTNYQGPSRINQYFHINLTGVLLPVLLSHWFPTDVATRIHPVGQRSFSWGEILHLQRLCMSTSRSARNFGVALYNSSAGDLSSKLFFGAGVLGTLASWCENIDVKVESWSSGFLKNSLEM